MLSSIIHLYRQSFRGLSAPTWYLSLVMLINRSGTMVVPFMTLYLTQHLGVSLGKAGIVMAIFGLGSVCGSLLGGKLTDRVGFYPVQIVTLIGGGIMFIVLGQMKSYNLICVFTFLLSLVNEAFRPANQTAIAFYSNAENRTRSYTLNRLAINIGWALGGAMGGFIAHYNYELLFWVDGITNIGGAILLLSLLPYSRQMAAHKAAAEKVVTKAKSVYTDKPYLVFVLCTTLFAICFFQLFATVPVFFKEEWLIDEQKVGLIMASNGLLIALFEMPIILRLDGRVNNLRTIAAGTLLVALSYIILNFFPPGIWLAFISTVVVTAGEIFSMPFMNAYWTARCTHSNRGQYAALYTMAYSIAFVLGPYSGSKLVEAGGYSLLWWVVGAVCGIAALGYYWLNQYSKKQV
jgi:predicted MFS family arabinose efflux permease